MGCRHPIQRTPARSAFQAFLESLPYCAVLFRNSLNRCTTTEVGVSRGHRSCALPLLQIIVFDLLVDGPVQVPACYEDRMPSNFSVVVLLFVDPHGLSPWFSRRRPRFSG